MKILRPTLAMISWPSSEIMNWNSGCDSWFIVNSGKSINLNTRLDPFLFVQNSFFTTRSLWHHFRYHYHEYATGNQDNDLEGPCSGEFSLIVFLCFYFDVITITRFASLQLISTWFANVLLKSWGSEEG